MRVVFSEALVDTIRHDGAIWIKRDHLIKWLLDCAKESEADIAPLFRDIAACLIQNDSKKAKT